MMVHWWIDDVIDWIKTIPFKIRAMFCKWKFRKMCPYRNTRYCNWTFCPMKEAKRYQEYVAMDKEVEDFLRLALNYPKFVGDKKVKDFLRLALKPKKRHRKINFV